MIWRREAFDVVICIYMKELELIKRHAKRARQDGRRTYESGALS